MCGIVAYNGVLSAVDFLIDGISQLEYRGYDSVGIALQNNNESKVLKEVGRVKDLLLTYPEINKESHTMGLAHTRWATHGEPSVINAHPHTSGKVTLVHNGIIDNYKEISERYLLDGGQSLQSETDSEVVAALINQTLDVLSSPLEVLSYVCALLKGSYALVVMVSGDPNLYAIRKGSPLLIGFSDHGHYIASDMTPLLKYTNEYALLEEGHIAVIDKNQSSLYDSTDLSQLEFEKKEATWSQTRSDKGDYPTYMIKEIHEQADIVQHNFNRYTSSGKVNFEDNLSRDFFEGVHRIHVIACGTAYHAGLLMKTWIEDKAKIAVEVHVASEFRYYPPIMNDSDVCVFISQSGETADVLACLDMVKSKNIKTLGIVNRDGSSIARSVDTLLLTHAGVEKSVASTKAYTAQLSIAYLLAHFIADISIDSMALESLVESMRDVGAMHDSIIDIASKYKNFKHAFYLGRGSDSHLALEGSLKLKEITYIHAESYPAGELKHGSIALIDDSIFTLGIALQSRTKDKTLSNLQEVKARGGKVLLLTDTIDNAVTSIADDIVYIKPISDELSVFLGIIPLQLLSYEICVQKGLDVDYPRNLAKSVTVE